MRAGLVTGAGAGAGFALADCRTFLAVTLADATHPFAAVLEVWQLYLGQRDRNDFTPALADQLAARDVLSEVLLYPTPDDSIESLLVSLYPLDR